MYIRKTNKIIIWEKGAQPNIAYGVQAKYTGDITYYKTTIKYWNEKSLKLSDKWNKVM